MVRKCIVPLCTSIYGDKNTSFHQLPCDLNKCKDWLKNIEAANPTGSDWTPNQYATICGLHFVEKDFKPSSKNRLLKPDAVPTIFPSYKDSQQNATSLKRKRKKPIPKKTPNKENISSDENMQVMDIDSTSGSAAEPDKADSDEEQGQDGSDAEQDEAGAVAEQGQIGSNTEQDQEDSAEEQDEVGFEDQDQVGSDEEHGQPSSEGEEGFQIEIDQDVLELEKVQTDTSYMTESNKTNTAYRSEPTIKRAKVDAVNKSSDAIYPISNIKQIHTPKQLKTLIRESKIKCAEKKLALVKEKLASKVVSRALQKALVVSKIKAETAKSDYYERKKTYLLQTKISHLKNEVPVSEEKFQTFEYLQSKTMEEEMATRIEERALQKQLFEAEIQASNEKQTYYVTKKTWLPIFMDHSDVK